jgi:MFS family permease
VPRADYALSVGVFRFSGDLGFTLGPLVAGFVAEIAGFREAFAVTAIPTLVALALVVRSAETLRVRVGAAAEPE